MPNQNAEPVTPSALLRQMFDAAVAAAQPSLCLPPHLPPPPKGRTIVIGAGKASAAMAMALEAHWPGPLEGLVVTRYGYQQPCHASRLFKPRTLCRTRPGWRPHNASRSSLPASAQTTWSLL